MTGRIAPGGCYPPTWPRPPKPPVPEPEPDSLDEKVDWMTYSHPELYAMVHKGLDLTGAMAVSAKWARLGDELADIGDELARLVVATSHAWEGDSAELAREGVSALAGWSQDTGFRATEVSSCITVQVDNATNARNAMPAPPYPADTTTMPSQATAFTSGDFDTARPLVSDPAEYTSRERSLHQQAARTMENFQENSRDVYATVPQFAPPSLRKQPRGGGPVEQPPQPPQPQPQPPVATVPSAQGASGGGAPVSGPLSGQAVPGGLSAAAPAAPLGAGSGTGTAEPASSRPAAAAAAASAKPGSSGPGMGAGMPMGGAGGQRGEDIERKSKKYIEEDEDVWGLEEPVMPPVIGEVNRRA